MKLQQLLLNLLAFVFLALAAVLVAQNMHTEVSFYWLSEQKYLIALGWLLLICGALVAAAIGCRMWSQLLALGQQHKRANRELERKDVSHEEAASQVKVLENKVQTLEKALSEALKRQS